MGLYIAGLLIVGIVVFVAGLLVYRKNAAKFKAIEDAATKKPEEK